MPSAEINKCMDYLGTEIDQSEVAHLSSAILDKLRKNDHFQYLSLAQLKNFLHNISSVDLENTRFLLDKRNFDVISLLTNQKLSKETSRLLQTFFNSKTIDFSHQTEIETRSYILSMGSLLCHETQDETIKQILVPKFVKDISLAIKNCPFEDINMLQSYIFNLLNDPMYDNRLIGNIDDLGIFGYLFLNQSYLRKFHDIKTQFIPFEAFEILPHEQIKRIPNQIFDKMSLKQATDLLTKNSEALNSRQREILISITNRNEKLEDFDDRFEVSRKIDAGEKPKVSDVAIVTQNNITSRLFRNTQLIYIISASENSRLNLIFIFFIMMKKYLV